MPLANCIAPRRPSPAQIIWHTRHSARGFTLVEIMTATGIMALVVSLVVLILTQVMTAWNNSSDDLTYSTNAHAVFDTIAQDLRGCILRSDGNQWLSLTTDAPPAGSSIPAVQDSRLIFFTNTPLHVMKDYSSAGSVGKYIAGDICAVEYRVTYADPFGAASAPGSATTTKTFSLHRVVVDPASTFFGVNNIPIMGVNAAFSSTPDLVSAFDAAVDVPAASGAGAAPITNTTPVVAIPYGSAKGPSALAVPVYGAYSTSNILLDNVAQFTVYLYFTGQGAATDAMSQQVFPQTAVNKNNPPSIYYGGKNSTLDPPTIAGGYLDALNDPTSPPVFLNLAYVDVTLSILTDDGLTYLQQNNGALPQGMTWPQFLQKFSKTFTQRVPILAAPH